MSELAVAVCSIAPTQRRRFFWAVWSTGAPAERPFRKPDASNGGARTREDAVAEAERASGRSLVEIEPHWARAWMRVLRGQPPWTPREEELFRGGPRAPRPGAGASARSDKASAWTVLGLEAGASEADIRRAHRRRSLETHPDRGGDAEVFRAVQHAYERALKKARGEAKSKKR